MPDFDFIYGFSILLKTYFGIKGASKVFQKSKSFLPINLRHSSQKVPTFCDVPTNFYLIRTKWAERKVADPSEDKVLTEEPPFVHPFVKPPFVEGFLGAEESKFVERTFWHQSSVSILARTSGCWKLVRHRNGLDRYRAGDSHCIHRIR